MIEVNHVQKSFGDIRALQDVSFQVDKGRILGFLGANGAGKTTTMDIICGCLGADQGTIKIEGIDISENPIEAKKKIGYLPDDPPLHNDMHVRDFLRYVGKLRGLKKTNLEKRLVEIIERLDLGNVSERLVGNLSKGFRQRVGLAQAIIHDPDVLVLDEPTEGLDPNQILEIRELIKSLKGDHTIVLSSHILSEVESTCDDIAIIDHGKILVQGSYAELKSASNFENPYRLVVKSDPGILVERLVGAKLTLSAQEVGPSLGGYELALSLPKSQETVDEILNVVLKGNHGIIEFSRKTSTLEEVFLKLTRTQEVGS